MAKHKKSYVKESVGATHVAVRPRDDDGKPKKGVHYLKPEVLAPRFRKEVSVHEADPPIEVEQVPDSPVDEDTDA